MREPNRRDVFKTALAGIAAERLAAAQRPLRIGFAGMGERARGLLGLALEMANVEVPAICGDAADVERGQALVAERRGARPQAYGDEESDVRRMCSRGDVDVVFNTLAAGRRAAVCLAAMNEGKHVASEVPAAATVEDCRRLVETAGKTGRQCTLLAGACYEREALMLLTMFRRGLLGEPLLAELIDCRAAGGETGSTDAFGPAAWWMNVTRGDRCTDLASTAAKAQPGGGFLRTTLIGTERGRTISLYLDRTVPRPAEKLVRVQGSKGAYSGLVGKIFVDGRTNSRSKTLDRDPEWESVDGYTKEFEHPLWKDGEAKSGDSLLVRSIVERLSQGKAPDIDVYDTAAWSAIAALSETAAAGRQTVEVPDFTAGAWKTRRPVEPGGRV